jgi:hypothetical protein
MNQEKYNELCDIMRVYKKTINLLLNEKDQRDLERCVKKLEKLLDDEYKYGSSWYDIRMIEKYMDKCNKIVNI